MRPYWHVDAKWIFGVACVISIVVASVLYSVSKLTEPDPATGVFAGVVSALIKEGGGSDGFDEIQARATANPDKQFTIEDVTLPVKGSDLAGLSYDEAVDLIVGRLADMFYADGTGSVEEFFQNTPEGDSVSGSTKDEGEFDLGPFSLLTEDSHDTVRRVFTFSLIPILAFAVPLVLFSRRFGRLGSPGVALAIGAAPFALLWMAVERATRGTGGDGIEGSLAVALNPTAGDVSGAFTRLFFLGVILILAAVAGHVGVGLWRRFRRTPAPATEAEASEKPADEGPATTGSDGPPHIAPGAAPQA